jgi:4-hydroxy 2-oxovalerate aldolase
VLDVTLRDGGCVNDFAFGQTYMDKILEAQEKAGIDIIELGYLDEMHGSESGRTKFISEKSIYKSFLKNKRPGIVYVAMLDYGKFDVNNLESYNVNGVDGIRLAFHKKDCLKAIAAGKIILEKGYELFMQPMITLRYSDEELITLIDNINKTMPSIKALYIVDSFGEMIGADLNRIWNIVNHNLFKNIGVGFHSHNNLQLSYSNAMEFMRISDERDILIDSSIMGMGKGAGNLNTELLLLELIRMGKERYSVPPILQVMDKVINQLHAEFRWGYAPEYYLSAINGCSPTYASYFYDKHMLPIECVNELLSSIREDKKISFDENYAEKTYKEFNEAIAVDDSEFVELLRNQILNRTVLLVAPGKSIIENDELIKRHIADKENVFSLGLNISKNYDFDYVMTTRDDIYEEVLKHEKDVIVVSNIRIKGRGKINVLNYSNWIIEQDKVYDSSFVILLKLLEIVNAKHLLLAGFDGFSNDMNENYYDPYLRHSLKDGQVEAYNSFNKNLVENFKRNGMDIVFLTESKYK